jgi:hypothetical protein
MFVLSPLQEHKAAAITEMKIKILNLLNALYFTSTINQVKLCKLLRLFKMSP